MKAALLLAAACSCLWAGQTTVLFQPASTAAGPFPSNALTTPDVTQKTGLRIDFADLSTDYDATCTALASPSVCSNADQLDQLDGFSVNPRMMVCFSGPVDTSTLKAGISIVPVAGGVPVPINQIIYEPTTNCAFAKPDRILNQQSRYVLAVTNAITDGQGQPVAADPAFTACLQSSDAYCRQLSAAVNGMPNLVAASLFTTMSATTWLEKARQYADLIPPVVLPAGFPWTYNVSNLKSITWVPEDNTGTTANQAQIPPSALAYVGKIVFGLYLSPDFVDPLNASIAVTPTNLPIVPGLPVPVSFHVFLPNSAAPASGFPVAIYGHGLADSQFGAPSYIASTLAKQGIATLAFEITGHGYGPLSVVNLVDKYGFTHTVSTPGRGLPLSPNGTFGPTDGCIALGAVAVRDCGRQTAVDLSALVHAIPAMQGLGVNLDANRVYYVGQSFGGTYGTLFHAIEPGVHAAVLNGDGGTSADVARLSITGRPLGQEFLTSVNPALLNVASGIAPPEAYFHDKFNDNYPLRDQAPIVNDIAGAMDIQAAFEAADWLGMLGDPLSFAPHLSTSPLAGVPAKATLFQFGFGDLEVSNPTESGVVLAANAQASTSFFHFEKAVAQYDPSLLSVFMIEGGIPFPILPHRVLSNPTIIDPRNASERVLALAEQQQVAGYFASNGASIPDANLFLTTPFPTNAGIFELSPTLPEALNFLQIPK